MAIWDSLRQDPMSAMILMQGLSDLTSSMSKQNLPPRGAYTPAGYGQQGGGMGDMIPQMLRMQQMQAQQANMAADNELQRRQFEASQAAEQQRAERIRRAVPGISAATGQPPEVVEAALMGGLDSNPLVKAIGSNAEDYTLDGVRFSGTDDSPIARAMKSVKLGAFDPVSGRTAIDPGIVNAEAGLARAGATNISTHFDARNMGNAAEGMQNALIEERKGLVGDIDTLRGEVESLSRGMDMALKRPEWTGPLAEERAALLRAKAVAIAPFGGSLSPDETEFLSFVDEFREGKFAQTLKKVEKLAPVTENEFAKAEETAVGADSPVPRIVTKALRAKKQYEYAMEKKRFIDQATHAMLQEARAGGEQFSPGRLQMLVEDWEKKNPFPMDSYVKELSALSQAYPVGGGNKPPAADADPLGLLTP